MIWAGGIIRSRHLVLKSRYGQSKDGKRWLLNGRPFDRHRWRYYLPPKEIRLMGRYAKEEPNILNTYPKEVKVREDGTKVRIRRNCSCGGKLIYDVHTHDLYCQECFLVSE